jgi:hypothetical protein
MTLLAVGTFALYTICPPAVAITGLAITVVVAAIYLYRHQQEIANKLGTFKESVFSFFKQPPAETGKFLPLLAEDQPPIR